MQVPDCEQELFKPVWFQIDTHWYKITPNSYLLFYAQDMHGSSFGCEIRFRPNKKKDKGHGVLGATFLENYF